MPLSALGLVIVAAALHATWHLLVKKTEQRQLFTGWVLAVAAVLYSPILLLFTPIVRAVWPYAVVSAIVQGTYYCLGTDIPCAEPWPWQLLPKCS